MFDVLLSVLRPFADIAGSPAFFVEVLIGGVFAGLMYSLVALGFVLIFKASGVFNFAQGVMVLFAALTLVGLIERGIPVALALPLTMLVMIVLDFAIERVVLRPLVNQPQINQLEMTAALTAGALVTILAVLFQKTRIGRALRAVADDHEAALSIGIPLKTI